MRAGLLTRDQALALVAVENRADPEVLREFFGLVGLNLEEVLGRIDSFPRLYLAHLAGLVRLVALIHGLKLVAASSRTSRA